MRVFYFSEQPYPAAWNLPDQSLRITLPNRHCDPRVAGDLYERYYDEWALADECGFNLMVNEHHSTPTCLSVSANVGLAIAARITRKARILALGVPIANRPDPVRVAEELSMIDVISKGRLEIGFVRGVPYEAAAAVSSPAGMGERFWEAHDLILEAMSSHNGPFDFNGEFFHYRNVNIWPRPYQAPFPPIWITSSSIGSMRTIARKRYVAATFLGGYATRSLFDAYREEWRAVHGGEPPPDRFAYLGMCAIGRNEREARARAKTLMATLKTNLRVAPAFQNPPGYVAPADSARAIKSGRGAPRPLTTRSGRPVNPYEASYEDLVDSGLLFAGTPDQVYDQIINFDAGMGGMENLLVMIHAGALSQLETAQSIRLFSDEVLPRLREHRSAGTMAAPLSKRAS
jgi:alkanesulfonate monooxygenase SsuD/methylene tetrahydromethanopterin reductase-like flavin-dependent oxidoreductase (luciferase family)